MGVFDEATGALNGSVDDVVAVRYRMPTPGRVPPQLQHSMRMGRATRGVIRERISAQTKHRFAQHLISRRNSYTALAVFISLTYGRSWDWAELDKHRRTLLSWLRYNYPAGRWHYALEYQKRLAPHWHFIFDADIDDAALDEFRRRLTEYWVGLTGSGGSDLAARLHYAVDVRRVYDVDGVSVYLIAELSKMASKLRPEAAPSLRWWGFGGVFKPPLTPQVQSALDESAEEFAGRNRRRVQLANMMFGAPYKTYETDTGSVGIITGFLFGCFAQYAHYGSPEAFKKCLEIIQKKQQRLDELALFEAINDNEEDEENAVQN